MGWDWGEEEEGGGRGGGLERTGSDTVSTING